MIAYKAICGVSFSPSPIAAPTSQCSPPPHLNQGFPKGGSDCYVTKRKQLSGKAVWTTQFGSSSDDRAAAIDVDTDGNVIVAGGTTGALFGQEDGKGYWDIFVAKLKGADGSMDCPQCWTRQVGPFVFESTVEGVLHAHFPNH